MKNSLKILAALSVVFISCDASGMQKFWHDVKKSIKSCCACCDIEEPSDDFFDPLNSSLRNIDPKCDYTAAADAEFYDFLDSFPKNQRQHLERGKQISILVKVEQEIQKLDLQNVLNIRPSLYDRCEQVIDRLDSELSEAPKYKGDKIKLERVRIENDFKECIDLFMMGKMRV